MSLFDGQPLTEAEVARRQLCICDHIRGSHRGCGECTMCGCDQFAAVSMLSPRGVKAYPPSGNAEDVAE